MQAKQSDKPKKRSTIQLTTRGIDSHMLYTQEYSRALVKQLNPDHGHSRPILKVLGEGGMGRVTLERRNGQNVAVKQILNADSAGTGLFSAEIRRHRQFQNHPHVVRFISGHMGEHPELVLEYVASGDLLQRIERAADGDHITAKEFKHIFLGCARGLQAIHEATLIHRDIKPDNILLGQNGDVKIADLGLSVAHIDGYRKLYGAAGTLEYCAPESLTEPHEYYCVSDTYSLGVVMISASTEYVPYRCNDSEEEFYRKKASGDLEVTIDERFSKSVAALLRSCTSFHPAKRPNDVTLERYIQILDEETPHLKR